MKFSELIGAVGEEPVFESSLLLAGRSDPDGVRRQLSRWTASGKIIKLRRGLYALSPPWRRRHPHPFLVANRLMPGTYVSGLSALAHARAIPEYVPETTSVGPGKPHIRQLPLGRFSFRHVKPRLLFGYQALAVDDDQQAFVATPEKAFLDLVYPPCRTPGPRSACWHSATACRCAVDAPPPSNETVKVARSEGRTMCHESMSARKTGFAVKAEPLRS